MTTQNIIHVNFLSLDLLSTPVISFLIEDVISFLIEDNFFNYKKKGKLVILLHLLCIPSCIFVLFPFLDRTGHASCLLSSFMEN